LEIPNVRKIQLNVIRVTSVCSIHATALIQYRRVTDRHTLRRARVRRQLIPASIVSRVQKKIIERAVCPISATFCVRPISRPVRHLRDIKSSSHTASDLATGQARFDVTRCDCACVSSGPMYLPLYVCAVVAETREQATESCLRLLRLHGPC